jgi:hypothetical protein
MDTLLVTNAKFIIYEVFAGEKLTFPLPFCRRSRERRLKFTFPTQNNKFIIIFIAGEMQNDVKLCHRIMKILCSTVRVRGKELAVYYIYGLRDAMIIIMDIN